MVKNNLTLKHILLVHEEIINNSRINNYNNLLSEKATEKYYNVELKKQIQQIFRKFKDLQYIISFEDEYSIQSKTNKEIPSFSDGKISDPVGDYVEKNIDYYTWEENLYYTLLELSKKLKYEEAIYLIDSFFEGKSEEQISEKMLICRMTLQKIKKSCLVKIKIEFARKNLL